MTEKSEPTHDMPLGPEPRPRVSESQAINEEYTSLFSPIERRSEPYKHVFTEDESSLRTVVPRVTHWSIAWSDLMMTMFILFLSMFVYQASHKEFLVSDEMEVVGGDTSEALQSIDDSEITFPIVPLGPGAPLITSGTVKKVERITIDQIDPDTPFFENGDVDQLERIRKRLKQPTLPPKAEEPAAAPEQEQPAPPAPATPVPQAPSEETAPPSPAGEKEVVVQRPEPQPEPQPDIIEPRPLTVEEPGVHPPSPQQQDQGRDKIFSLSEADVSKLDLEKFASFNLAPDKTVRIILTGDLLFDTGQATLSESARASLTKIGAVIKNTPYMINVIGHTDNTPMSSGTYATNWELSVARASIVARFLVENIGMNPAQFVVSGFASYRPVRPNTNARNRALNRRVEIIISKRLPRPQKASAENLQ